MLIQERFNQMPVPPPNWSTGSLRCCYKSSAGGAMQHHIPSGSPKSHRSKPGSRGYSDGSSDDQARRQNSLVIFALRTQWLRRGSLRVKEEHPCPPKQRRCRNHKPPWRVGCEDITRSNEQNRVDPIPTVTPAGSEDRATLSRFPDNRSI
ncbi:hypothetical protein DPEC_G00194060 [Dallia pectoralis]|uniref:Uncharacterized protein n=1 Tax=Dallia pectoralis TaxID=75939 RepID=A0ACC2G7A5_DALPE|nr:hypothetical protein DPEC_G00194060 [Dallia pectoralis]